MELDNITNIKGYAFNSNKYEKISFPNLKVISGEQNFANNKKLKYLNIGNADILSNKIVDGCNNLEKIYIKKPTNMSKLEDIKNPDNASDIGNNSQNVKIYVRNQNLFNLLNSSLNSFIKNHSSTNIILQHSFKTSEHTKEEFISALESENFFEIIDDKDMLKDWDVNFKNSNESIEYVDLTNSAMTKIPNKYFENSNISSVKFSENVSEFGDSVFDNAVNLKEIELKQPISTKFGVASIGCNPDIKITVNNNNDYSQLIDSTIFIQPHKITNIIKQTTYIVPEESYNQNEITKVITEETSYTNVIDEFGIINKLDNDKIKNLNKLPNNILSITIKDIPFKNPDFSWNKVENVVIKGTDQEIPSFKNSDVVYVDISEATLKDNKLSDNFFNNCENLKTLIMNQTVDGLGDNVFNGCSEDLEIIVNYV